MTPTSRVSKEVRAIAAQARNKEYTRARTAGEPRNEDKEFLAGLEAALSTMGDVVAVSEIEALRDEVRAQARLKDHYADWEETERMFDAILNRGGK